MLSHVALSAASRYTFGGIQLGRSRRGKNLNTPSKIKERMFFYYYQIFVCFFFGELFSFDVSAEVFLILSQLVYFIARIIFIVFVFTLLRDGEFFTYSLYLDMFLLLREMFFDVGIPFMFRRLKVEKP